MLQRDVLPLFVTLTYHNEYPDNFEDYKNQLDNFLRSLSRRFGRYVTKEVIIKGEKVLKEVWETSVGVIWKMEYQQRGAPHYHLFVWGVSLEELREFVPEKWHKIAGYGSPDHLAWHKGELGNEHCVQSVKSWHGVRSYASKYFAKLDDTKNRGGRVWGVRGKVPFSKILEYRVNLQVALELRQLLIIQNNYDFQRLGFWTFDYSVELLSFFDSLIDAWEVLQKVPDDPPDWDLFAVPPYQLDLF
jgi:hypothetical protein